MRAVFSYILLFLLLTLSGFLYFAYDSDYFNLRTKIDNPNFVTITDDGFWLKGEKFYPVVLNYIVSMQTNGNIIWPSSYKGYGANSDFNHEDKEKCLEELANEMQMIRDMGFNTVRIVGIGEQGIMDKQSGLLSIRAHYGNKRDTVFFLSEEENFSRYMTAIDEVIQIAGNADLKVIFLTRVFDEIPSTKDHLKKLLTYFKHDSTIMAFDLFNEPLYFDSLARDKKDVYYITKSWQKIVNKNAPHHLSTIGLAGIREVFEWDPNLIHFDFISFHPYEYEPEQVRNELYWYYKNITVPWIVGETAIPADNDSIPYDEQAAFARKTLKQTFDCNGKGYSWWQYKDVEWFDFHPNFMGIMSKDGFSETSSGKQVRGKPKPIVDVFREFNDAVTRDSCLCLDNYYNYSNGTEFRLKGRLLDEKGNPINGGVILAWNENWSSSFHTTTRADGTFEVMGTFSFYHWMASATLFSMVRGDIDPQQASTEMDLIPTVDLGDLNVKKLREKVR